MHQYWKHDAEVDIRQAYRRGNGFMFIFSTFFVKLYSDAKVAFFGIRLPITDKSCLGPFWGRLGVIIAGDKRGPQY